MRDVLRIFLSPVAWLALFSAVYGLHGVVCEIDADGTILGVEWRRMVLVLAFGLAVLVQAGLLAMLYSTHYGSGPGLARVVSRTGGWVGLVATIWTLFPTVATSSCG